LGIIETVKNPSLFNSPLNYLIAIICDIEKAFLQVSIHPTHRDSMRFLWVKNTDFPPSRNNMKILRFTRVTFGLAHSPFLLAATIRFHLSKYWL